MPSHRPAIMGTMQRWTRSQLTLFNRWVDYIERLLRLSHDRVMESGPLNNPNGDVDTIAYAMGLANFSSLLYRAAGFRTRDSIDRDDILCALYREVEAELPDLYALRNALLAHPPFVDELVDVDEALAITSGQVSRFPATGGMVTPVVDVFITQTKVPGWVSRFRDRIEAMIDEDADPDVAGQRDEI